MTTIPVDPRTSRTLEILFNASDASLSMYSQTRLLLHPWDRQNVVTLGGVDVKWAEAH